MRNIKRWLASLLCVALLFSTVSVFDAMPKAKAASSYDGAAAARWAGQNYTGNYGKCAEFVSHCLRDGGGLSGVYSASTSTLYSQLKNSGLFTEYKMTLSGKRIHPTVSANAGKIAVGDVLIVHNLDSPSTYPHTSIVQAIEGDYVYIAQRNPAMAKGDQYAEYQNYKTYDQNGTNYEILCMHYTGGSQEDRCSTAYAGWYYVSADKTAIHSSHNLSSYERNAVEDQRVYVTKATGTGAGQLGHITLSDGKEHYIAMAGLTRLTGLKSSQMGYFTDVTGDYTTFDGIAYNWDDLNEKVTVRIVADSGQEVTAVANQPGYNPLYRWSVITHNEESQGENHKYIAKLGRLSSGKHLIHLYIYSSKGGGWIETETMEITVKDTVRPEISNVQVTNVTTEGYDVSCTVTDDVGVNRVQFPTWTEANGQDDLLSEWSTNPKASGTRNGDVWTFHVNIADHNNERGTYRTHIYAYDDAGNVQSVASGGVVPEPDPILTFDANGGTAEFTTKQAERGAAYGALPEAWMDGYVFDGWYTDAVGGDRVSSSTVYTAAGHTTLYAHWIPVAADAAQGWALQDGTLIITVQGAMQDYTSARETPWFSNRADIRKIVVQNGVTSIGDYAFYGCENVTSVTLPGTVTQIGKLAFYGCKGLTSLELPESVAVVEDYAFAKASGLKTITFHGSAPLFGAGIFADVNADARCPAGDSSWTDTVRQSYTGSIRWSGVSEAELAAQTSELQLDDPVLESLLADSCV